ncbi:replication factor C small subunit, partial [Candidatus Bathyarchaeota archaeon]
MSSEMWVEKYRPKSLDEMINQEEIVARLKRFVEERNLP